MNLHCYRLVYYLNVYYLSSITTARSLDWNEGEGACNIKQLKEMEKLK